jgi:hypothetical protein
MSLKSVMVGALALSLASPVWADEQQASFDLQLKGIRAGSLSWSAVEDGKSYSVAGRLKTGGLVALIRKVRYDASANGGLSKGRFVPASYSENADTGRRQSQAVMAYKGGVPQVKSYNPPREPKDYDVDPATMGGTVDPLTGMYAVLKSVEPGQECQVSQPMFDGRRHTQVKTFERQESGDQVVCQGEYRRLAGYSAEDLAEKTRFPFTMIYAPDGNGKMMVTEVSMETVYGKAKLIRR